MKRYEAIGILAGAASSWAVGAVAPAAGAGLSRFGELEWLRVAADRNSVISTLGVFEAVAALAYGASPAAQIKLVEALELEPQTLDALLEFFKQRRADTRSLSSAGVLHVSSPRAITAAQREGLLRDLNCRVADDGRHSDELLAQIAGPADAAWISQRRSAVESSEFSIVNITQLALRWEAPFDPRESFQGPFHSGSRDTVVTYMRRGGTYRIQQLLAGVVVFLPFANGMSMVLFLPRDVRRLVTGWERAVAGELKAGDVAHSEAVLVMPKFAFNSVVRFGATLARTVGFSRDDTIYGYPATRLAATQLARVRVNESGASLSAATVIARPKRKHAVPAITFDRPFGFGVLDANATVLFKGSVFDPR